MMYWGLLMPVMCWRNLLSEYQKCLMSLLAAGKIGLNICESSAMCGVDALQIVQSCNLHDQIYGVLHEAQTIQKPAHGLLT